MIDLASDSRSKQFDCQVNLLFWLHHTCFNVQNIAYKGQDNIYSNVQIAVFIHAIGLEALATDILIYINTIVTNQS